MIIPAAFLAGALFSVICYAWGWSVNLQVGFGLVGYALVLFISEGVRL